MKSQTLEITKMTKEDIDNMMAEHNRLNPDMEIRPDIKEALDDWAQNGHMPGNFLRAVLENNLMEAFARADSYNRASLYHICQYIYNDLPSNCHGSPLLVKEWQIEMRKGSEA